MIKSNEFFSGLFSGVFAGHPGQESQWIPDGGERLPGGGNRPPSGHKRGESGGKQPWVVAQKRFTKELLKFVAVRNTSSTRTMRIKSSISSIEMHVVSMSHFSDALHKPNQRRRLIIKF